MLNRLSFRILTGALLAGCLPLVVAVSLLQSSNRGVVEEGQRSSARALIETLEPEIRDRLDQLLLGLQTVRQNPVLLDPAAADRARLEVLRAVVEAEPLLLGATLHRKTDVPLTTLKSLPESPGVSAWSGSREDRVVTAVRKLDGGHLVSLLGCTRNPLVADPDALLEYHLNPTALIGTMARITSQDVALLDRWGQVLAHRELHWIGRSFDDDAGHDSSVLSLPVQAKEGGLEDPWRLGVRLDGRPRALVAANTARSFLAGILLAIGIGSVVAWYLSTWIHQPVERAAEAVAQMENRKFNSRLVEAGPVTVRTLASRLNALAQKLEHFHGQTRHELETTSHRLEEEEIRAGDLDAQLDAVTATSRDGILILTADGGEVVLNNDRFLQFGAFHKNDLATIDPQQLPQRIAWQFVETESFLEWWKKAVDRLEDEPSQVWALRQPEDGAARVSLAPLRDEQDEVTGMVWRFQDRTEETRLERKAENVEKAELIGNLTSGIGHEFNRILTGVVGNLATLEQDATPEERQQLIEHAKASANQAAAISRGLLSYSQAHLLESRVNSVQKMLRWLEDELTAFLGPEHRVEVDVPESAIHMTADRDRIRSVLLELCSNAVRAMPHGGTLSVAAEPLQFGSDAADLEAGRFICFTVKDTGKGISEEIRGRIFEPFFTTDSRANGLGLAAVSGIVWQHGGWITCDSAVDEGTCVRVYLPASELPVNVVVESGSEPVEAKEVTDTASEGRGEQAVPTGDFVLVVDDEASVRRLTQAILKRGGYDSMGAVDGYDGLDRYRQYKDRITLIILDLNMPGMSGAEFFQVLRAEFKHVPVIVVSGYLLDFNAFEMDSGGRPSAFIQKPYQADQFLEQVDAVLAPRAAA